MDALPDDVETLKKMVLAAQKDHDDVVKLDDIPSWGKELKTELRHLSDRVQELRENTSIDFAQLKKSIRLAYCRSGRSQNLSHDSDACAALLACSNIENSTMMSVSEIVADYVVNEREFVGERGGDCQAAARAAEKFFRSRKLMQTKFQECVLYSPSDESITAQVHAAAPAKHGVLKAGMKAHKLIDGSCVWEPDVQTPLIEGAAGYKHCVAAVTTLENVRVAVDWGVGQFPKLPQDMRRHRMQVRAVCGMLMHEWGCMRDIGTRDVPQGSPRP
eukprot:361551-Chlamydomonas_euryale.AAC.1